MKKVFFKKVSGYFTAAAMLFSFLTALPSEFYSVKADSDIQINETNFPDQYFRGYIKERFDKDDSDSLSQEEISCAQIIDVAYYEGEGLEYLKDFKNIKNLRGIGWFTSLEYLHCGYLDITSLDLSQNTALKRLECENCKLMSLDLTKNTALAELHCNNNELTSLDLSKNTELLEVDCSDNQITSLSINSSPKLGVLRFSNNKVKNIDISNDTGLKELCCSGNQLTSLDLSKNTGLIRIECSENQLTSLNLDNIKGFDGQPEEVIYDIWKPLYGEPCPIGTIVEPGFECYKNIYRINAENGSYELSGLPTGFNTGRSGSWNGAVLSGNTLNNITGVNDQEKITYTYDCGKGKTALFTLAYGDNADFSSSDDIICRTGEILNADYTSGMIESGSGDIYYMRRTENYTGAEDISNLKWVLYTVNDKGSSNAKFGGTDKKGNIVYNLSSVTGKNEVTIGALKANGKFNNTVVLKAVSKDYNPSKNKGCVYAECVIYINPALVTKFKAINDNKNAPGFIYKNDKTGISLTQVTDNTCKLTIPETSSYKLPFAAADGADKVLSYETDSTCFTVLNGTVKGLSAGTGTITVRPVYGIRECEYTVNVEVTGKISKLRSNVSSVTLYPDTEQIFTVSPSTSSNMSEIINVAFNKDASAYNLETSTDNGNSWDTSGGNGIQAKGPVMFKLSLKPGSTVKASEKMIITSDKTAAKLNISVKYAAAPKNIKAFTEKIKLAKGAEYRVVNIPVNSFYTLNCSVNPADADNRFTFREVDANGNLTSASDNIIINGDVIKGVDPGTVYVQAVTEGINADSQKVKSGIYQINVYSPASSIIWTDKDYRVKGGYLMTRESADTTTDKNIGDKYVHITMPEAKGTEHITWTADKTDAANVAEIGDNDGNWFLEIGLFKPGTYTITGTSDITKQKFSFKILVPKKENPNPIVKGVYYKKKGEQNYNYSNNCLSNYLELEVGSTAQLIPVVTDDTCVNMTFTSSGSKFVTVSKTGLVKAVKYTEDQVNITITIGSASVIVKVKTKAVPAVPKVTVPAYAAAGKVFAVSTNMKNAKWYCRGADSNNINDIKELTVSKGKVTGGLEKGTYYIFPSAASGLENISPDFKYAKPIRVYAPAAVSVKALEPSAVIAENNGVYSRDENVPDTLTIKNMANSKKGAPCGTRFILPVSAFDGTSADKQKAEKDDIVWTTSNANLAVVKPVNAYSLTENTEGDTYAEYAVELNDNGYTGKVTLTGILKNCGKKVTVTIYVTK